MFSFDAWLNLPFAWGILIAVAIFLYVLLDGFDLGIGILSPFAPTQDCRTKLMNSIAPFWDGNETWLVLAGGGLFVAFPLAYAILLPAFYIPIILLLIALIFRGVAFEFRFKSEGKRRRVWDAAFHLGSVVAAFMQGSVLGGVVQGVPVDGRQFAGGDFEWFTGFSCVTGFALIVGYVLLGVTWVVYKTDGVTQRWAKKIVPYALLGALIFMGVVAFWFPQLNPAVVDDWFGGDNVYYFAIAIVFLLVLAGVLIRALRAGRELIPFFAALGLFAVPYLGLIFSLWPNIVPPHVTLTEAAAAPESLSLLLVGAVLMLPIILGYVGYCYYVFRGKTTSDEMY